MSEADDLVELITGDVDLICDIGDEVGGFRTVWEFRDRDAFFGPWPVVTRAPSGQHYRWEAATSQLLHPFCHPVHPLAPEPVYLDPDTQVWRPVMTDSPVTVPGIPGDVVGYLAGFPFLHGWSFAQWDYSTMGLPKTVADAEKLIEHRLKPSDNAEVLAVVRLNGTPQQPKDDLDALAETIAELQVQLKGEHGELVQRLWDTLAERREQRETDFAIGKRLFEMNTLATPPDLLELGRAARRAVDAVRSEQKPVSDA